MDMSGGKFEDFENEDRELGEKMYQKRLVLMESAIKDLIERIGKMEKRTSLLEEENQQPRKN